MAMSSASVEEQVRRLRNGMIRELQLAVELLTRATDHAERDDISRVRQLARAASAISRSSARTASVIELLE